MAIKSYKPINSGRRGMTNIDFNTVLSGHAPEKSLLVQLKNSGGRNNQGVVTVRHKGGGHKSKYRIVDFKRNKLNIPGRVASIEYDPNRSAFISLINYRDGEKRYILHCLGLTVGSTVLAGPDSPIEPGNALPLSAIPDGTVIHNIELKPHKGGQLVRSAGASAQLISHEENGKYALVRLRSGEVRRVLQQCYATIGTLSNSDHNLINLGKAGRKR